MPGLLSQAYQKPRETYNQPRLTSYAGYPVVSAQSIPGLTDYFKGEGNIVAGMAWGGKYNDPGQGGGSSPASVVVNPYKFKNDPQGYNALVRLESARHWMDENQYNPEFKITPEMQKWRENTFTGIEAGKYYLNDDKLFKQTLISRIIAGDQDIPNISKEVGKEARSVQQSLEKQDKASKPTITQSIMSAMGMKKK
jgi:hypothetical protein